MIRNNQQPDKKVIGSFPGRPDIDTGAPSDPERQYQREMQPYGQRYFKPGQDVGVGSIGKKIAGEIFAGGEINENKSFFNIRFKETLDNNTRERVLEVYDRNGANLLKITDKGEVKIKGMDIINEINQIKQRLNNAGI